MRKRGIVTYATEQGLGRQAKSYFDNDLIDEVFVWPHSSYVNHYDWYPDRVKNYDELLEKCDEIWFLETPFDWSFIKRAREKGVKTVLFLMYECSRNPLPYIPDVLVGGSVMEQEHFGPSVTFVNVPRDNAIKWKLRSKAQVFVHNAGHGGLGGRNGTKELLEAMQYVKSPIKLIIRTQALEFKSDDPRVEIRIGDFPYETLFDEGDAFIYPDKFGGSCLPLQEAHASGMLVIASNRHPSNTWLPIEPLIPIQGYKKGRISSEIDIAIVDPKDIAKTIDDWYNKDIEKFSLLGRDWGENNSWEKLKPIYESL